MVSSGSCGYFILTTCKAAWLIHTQHPTPTPTPTPTPYLPPPTHPCPHPYPPTPAPPPTPTPTHPHAHEIVDISFCKCPVIIVVIAHGDHNDFNCVYEDFIDEYDANEDDADDGVVETKP